MDHVHRKRSALLWFRRAIGWAAWPLLLVPATIFLHEAGHFLAALAFGFPELAMHFSTISHGDVTDRPGWQSGMVGMAGPLITYLAIAAGICFNRRMPDARWPMAFAAAAASRLLVGVPYSVMSLAMLAFGHRLNPPAFDEYKAGVMLGLPGNALLGLSAIIFFATLAWLALRLPKGERSAAWPGLLVGTALGWALWFTVGPVLLP